MSLVCCSCKRAVDETSEAILIFKRPKLPELIYCGRVSCLAVGTDEAKTVARRFAAGILPEIAERS